MRYYYFIIVGYDVVQKLSGTLCSRKSGKDGHAFKSAICHAIQVSLLAICSAYNILFSPSRKMSTAAPASVWRCRRCGGHLTGVRLSTVGEILYNTCGLPISWFVN